MLNDETRRDGTRCKRWGEAQRKTGGTRGLLLTVLRADLYSSVVAIYNLNYLPLSLRKRGFVLETRGNSENGEAAVSLCGMDAPRALSVLWRRRVGRVRRGGRTCRAMRKAGS